MNLIVLMKILDARKVAGAIKPDYYTGNYIR